MIKALLILVRKMTYTVCYVVDKLTGKQTKLTVLCYHSISNDGWRFSTSKETFMQQINYLLETGHTFVDIIQLEKFINGELELNKAIFLTFDDGYIDLFEVEDFLKSKNIKPMVFIITNSNNYDWESLGIKTQKSFMNKTALQRVLTNGWAIGSHSATHKDFNKLNEQDMQREITDSKAELEETLAKTGTKLNAVLTVKYFSYPKGVYNKKILDKVKSTGYSGAFSMDDGFITTATNKYAIPRVGIDITHSTSEVLHAIMPSAIRFRSIVKKHISKYLFERTFLCLI